MNCEVNTSPCFKIKIDVGFSVSNELAISNFVSNDSQLKFAFSSCSLYITDKGELPT